jgi:hypothetical protein
MASAVAGGPVGDMIRESSATSRCTTASWVARAPNENYFDGEICFEKNLQFGRKIIAIGRAAA